MRPRSHSLLFLALLVAAFAVSANAQCRRWDAGWNWTLTQGKNSVLYLNLKQNGDSLTGQVSNTVNRGGKLTTYTASVDGTIVGSNFNVQMYWSGEVIGVYTGTVNAQGRIEGTTYDKKNPKSRAGWYSNQFMRCIQR